MIDPTIYAKRDSSNNGNNQGLELPAQASTLSNKWQVTILKTLKGLDAFKEYSIGEKVELPESENEMVGWDQFKIHSIDQKRPYTTGLESCLGLTARGYDETGQLSHLGIAHVFMSDNLHQKFFDGMRARVKGRIELFIAGGTYKKEALIEKVIHAAREAKIEIVDDVSKKFCKPIGLLYSISPSYNMLYRGTSGIAQIYFDKMFNPQIVADLEITGIENLEEVTSGPLCKLQQLPDRAL